MLELLLLGAYIFISPLIFPLISTIAKCFHIDSRPNYFFGFGITLIVTVHIGFAVAIFYASMMATPKNEKGLKVWILATVLCFVSLGMLLLMYYTFTKKGCVIPGEVIMLKAGTLLMVINVLLTAMFVSLIRTETSTSFWSTVVAFFAKRKEEKQKSRQSEIKNFIENLHTLKNNRLNNKEFQFDPTSLVTQAEMNNFDIVSGALKRLKTQAQGKIRNIACEEVLKTLTIDKDVITAVQNHIQSQSNTDLNDFFEALQTEYRYKKDYDTTTNYDQKIADVKELKEKTEQQYKDLAVTKLDNKNALETYDNLIKKADRLMPSAIPFM